MYELNIFKEKLREHAFSAKVSRICMVFYAVFGIIILALGLRVLSFSAELARDKKKIAAFQQMIDSDRQTYDISTLETEWNSYAVKLRLISAIAQNRTHWAEAMRDLADITPMGVCIKNIGLKTEDNVHSVVLEVLLSSRSKSGYELTDLFMSSLKKNSFFSGEMRLVSQERTILENKELEFVRIAISIPVK